METCAWCGEIINEPEGDDKVAHGNDYYHFPCLEEMMGEQE